MGVHGAGKTTTATKLKELNFEVIYSDVAKLKAGFLSKIPEIDKYTRELFFTYLSFAGFSLFTGYLNSKKKPSVLDPSPLLVIPYVKFFLGKKGTGLVRKVWSTYEEIRSLLDKDITPVHVILYASNSTAERVILARVLKRERKPLLFEEKDIRYIHFINKEILNVAKKLERKGEKVIYVPAELELDKRIEIILNELKKLGFDGF